MSARFAMWASLLLALLSPAGNAVRGVEPAGKDIRVIPIRVSVNRVRYLIKPPASKVTPSMTVQLRFQGKPLAKASRIGRLKIEKAEDDAGNDLRSLSTNFLLKNLRPLTSIHYKSDDAGGPRYDQSIYFAAPAKTARSVAALKGEITFVLSESATVTVPVGQLAGLVGKPLQDPLLKKKQLKVVIERYTPRSGSLRVKVTGPQKSHELFLRVSLLNAQGKETKTARPFQGFTYASANLFTFKPFPADHKIAFVFETGRKEVTVPFHLTDIPLP